MLSGTRLVSNYRICTQHLYSLQRGSIRTRCSLPKKDPGEPLTNATLDKFTKCKVPQAALSRIVENLSKSLSSVQSKLGFNRNEASKEEELRHIRNRFVFCSGAAAAATTVVSAPVELAANGLPIILEPIPEPPPIPEVVPQGVADAATEAALQINALGEPTFASLGLGGYTPVGIVQNCFEYLHVTLDVPWWLAIAIGTVIIRSCMFPLVVIAQRNAAKMSNNMPQLQVLQMKMTDARQRGNQLEVMRYSQEMVQFMKEKELNPFKNLIVPLCQMPIFISFFMALRKMANVPVDSMRTGGLWWFTDLTVPDQFFIMPVITSLTLWATIELGTDSAKLSSQNLQTMKYVLRALPVVILPFIINFPGAILCYWVCTNFISLGQVGLLRIPAVRDYFKIEPTIQFKPENLPMKPKGFAEGVKDSWTNMKITKELEERGRLDQLQFQRAGKGPLVKTFKYDPTKQTRTASANK